MYRISSYSFRGNYSFLNLTLLHTGAETIQGRKLYEEIRYVECRYVTSVS